jgi:AraC-like DNA-binding protein
MGVAALILNVITLANLSAVLGLVAIQGGRTVPGRILCAIAFDQAVFYLANVCILTGWIHYVPHLLFLAYLAVFLNPLLISIYVDRLLGRKTERFHPLYILSGLSVLLIVYAWLGFLAMGAADRLYFLDSLTGSNYPWRMNLLNYFLVLTQFLYLLPPIVRARRYLKGADQGPLGDTTGIRSSQSNNVLIFAVNLTMVAFYALLPTRAVVFVVQPIAINVMYVWFSLSIYHYSVVFRSASKPPGRHASFRLEPELVESYTSRIVRFIEDQKPYVDPDLTLEKLALQLDIPKYHLSFVINTHLEKGFFDLINYYRVEEAKKLLLDGGMKALSVDSVGYEVGFNTKSAFYRWFKKLTGKTPALFSRSVPSSR